VAGREIAVKKYVVNLSAEERERLEILLDAGRSPAQLLTRAQTAMGDPTRRQRRLRRRHGRRAGNLPSDPDRPSCVWMKRRNS
jgi:hypothetical protein